MVGQAPVAAQAELAALAEREALLASQAEVALASAAAAEARAELQRSTLISSGGVGDSLGRSQELRSALSGSATSGCTGSLLWAGAGGFVAKLAARGERNDESGQNCRQGLSETFRPRRLQRNPLALAVLGAGTVE